MKELKGRWKAKTPNFWKKIQKVPIALPAAVVTVAGYVVTAGTVAATLSQLTVENYKDITKVTNKNK
jgi:hypothetical protein